MLKNQALAIETFQRKWQMAGQEARAFVAKTRSQSEDIAWAELMAVQRFEIVFSLNGQLRSHFRALQDECRDHVGQEENCARSSSRPYSKNLPRVKSNCIKPDDIKSVRRSMQMKWLHERLISFTIP